MEAHDNCVRGNFDRDKILALLKDKFFRPKMGHNVMKLVERCQIYYIAKSHGRNTGLYTSLPVPKAPLEDINLDFIVGLLRTQRNKDFLMVVVDRFSKMALLIPCIKTVDAYNVADLYFKEIMKLHVFQKPSFHIKILIFGVTFKECYGEYLALLSISALLIILKLMVKQESQIEVWDIYYEVLLVKISGNGIVFCLNLNLLIINQVINQLVKVLLRWQKTY